VLASFPAGMEPRRQLRIDWIAGCGPFHPAALGPRFGGALSVAASVAGLSHPQRVRFIAPPEPAGHALSQRRTCMPATATAIRRQESAR
jgi:hypothetical protein